MFVEGDRTYDAAVKLFESMDSKNLIQKLESIPNFSYKDDLFGNTLFHAALEGISGEESFLIDVLEELFVRGADMKEPNHGNLLPIHMAVTNGLVETITWMLQREPEMIEAFHPDLNLALINYAVFEESLPSLQTIHKINPDLIDKKDLKGYRPINQYVAKCESTFQSSFSDYEETRKEWTNKIEKNDDVMNFLLENSCIESFFHNGKLGTVLHGLVRLNYYAGIEILLKRLEDKPEMRKRILESKDFEQKSPLFCALERSVDKYMAARILLKYGADPNEEFVIKYRAATQTDNATNIRSMRMRSQTTIERVLEKANEKDKASDVIKEMLPSMKNPQQAVECILESILDDSSPSLGLLIIALTHAEKKNIEVKHLINDPNLMAMHTLMKSNLRDISEEMNLLLRHGADVLIPVKSENYRNNLMPIHIAVSLQHSFDSRDNTCEFGYSGDFAKLRLRQYLTSITEFGISKLIERQTQRDKMEYRVDFVRYHLIPGVYSADPLFIHSLMKEFDKISLEKKNEIIHFKDVNHKVFDKTPLYWATRQTQQSILSDIVKSEFYSHNTKTDGKSSKPNGIECFENLPDTYSKSLATRIYLDLFEPELVWYKNLDTAFFQVLIFSYMLFAFDLYLDIELIRAYQDQENCLLNMINNSSSFISNGTNCEVLSNQDPNNYRISRYISIALIVPSILGYMFLTWFDFTLPHSLRIYDSQIWTCFISIFNPIIFPFVFLGRQVRSSTEPNSFGKSQRLEECKRLWMIIRRVEVGIESAGQLILQVWLFGPYFSVVKSWDSTETFEHIWRGLGNLFSLGNAEANFVEIMMAKFLLSMIVTCGGISFIRITKQSQTGISFPGFILYFIGCVSQMVARFMTLRLFFMIDMDKYYHLAYIIIHVMLDIAIKITFEWPPLMPDIPLKRKIHQMSENVIRAIISSCCGTLVYLNINRGEAAKQAENNDYKNTFFPFIIHVILCVIEHCVVISIFTEEEKSLQFVIAPLIILPVSLVIHAFYYQWFHPANVLGTNGPKFLPEENLLCTCSTLFCCQMVDECKVPRGYRKLSKVSKNNEILLEDMHNQRNGNANHVPV